MTTETPTPNCTCKFYCGALHEKECPCYQPMAPTPAPTPITDRETYTVKQCDIGFQVTPVSCSRQLEEKLAAANAENARLRDALEMMYDKYEIRGNGDDLYEVREQLATTQAQLEAERKVHSLIAEEHKECFAKWQDERKAREEAERQAGRRYSSIAKAVYETVQDHAATWDTASDELIWNDPNVDCANEKHWKVSDDWVNTCCARFPQWADDLHAFAKRWNEDEPITDEMLAEVEIDEKDIEQHTRRATQIMRFYDKLRKTEQRAESLERRLAKCEKDASRWNRFSSTGYPKATSPVYSSDPSPNKWIQIINGKTWQFDSANEAIDAAIESAEQGRRAAGKGGE